LCFTLTTRKLRSRSNVFDPVHFQCHCQPRIKSLAFAMPFLRRFSVCKERLSTSATADCQPCPNTVAPGQAHAPMEADRIKRIQHRPLSHGLVYGSLDLSSVGDVGFVERGLQWLVDGGRKMESQAFTFAAKLLARLNRLPRTGE